MGEKTRITLDDRILLDQQRDDIVRMEVTVDTEEGGSFVRLLPYNKEIRAINCGDFVLVRGIMCVVAITGRDFSKHPNIYLLNAFPLKDGKRLKWMEKEYPAPEVYNIDKLFENYNPFGSIQNGDLFTNHEPYSDKIH